MYCTDKKSGKKHGTMKKSGKQVLHCGEKWKKVLHSEEKWENSTGMAHLHSHWRACSLLSRLLLQLKLWFLLNLFLLLLDIVFVVEHWSEGKIVLQKFSSQSSGGGAAEWQLNLLKRQLQANGASSWKWQLQKPKCEPDSSSYWMETKFRKIGKFLKTLPKFSTNHHS